MPEAISMQPFRFALLAMLLLAPAAATAAQGAAKAQATAKPIVNALGMRFVPIPPGSFVMGSPPDEPGRDDDERQHRVTLSRGFHMQTTEVTQGQWKAVMGDNPSGFRACGDDCPVEGLSWDMVQAFIDKLNRLEPGKRYRLPTEAEWEYAARAGSAGPFATGDCLSTAQANYNGEHPLPGCAKGTFRQGPMPVASFAPNAWGLYDMHGNVWELCQDWYGEYPRGEVTDPKGPPTGSHRVVRGGSWRFHASFARSANRFRNIRDFTGFRLVLEPGSSR